jgi:hypothetical protein
MQIPELSFCRHRVYLTHVSALVFFLHVCNVQEPGFVLIVLVMCHGNSWISSNYVIMYSQYCWLLEVHPSHLEMRRKGWKMIFSHIFHHIIIIGKFILEKSQLCMLIESFSLQGKFFYFYWHFPSSLCSLAFRILIFLPSHFRLRDYWSTLALFFFSQC